MPAVDVLSTIYCNNVRKTCEAKSEKDKSTVSISKKVPGSRFNVSGTWEIYSKHWDSSSDSILTVDNVYLFPN